VFSPKAFDDAAAITRSYSRSADLPGIDFQFNKVDKLRGLNIFIVITPGYDQRASLLKAMGMPFIIEIQI